jgi:hypothetical protein
MSRTYRRCQALHRAAEWPCTPFYPEDAHEAEEIRRLARFHSDAGERLLHERYEGGVYPRLPHGAARALVRDRLRRHRLPEDDTPEMPVPIGRDLIREYP